jgi:hypothetical protein
MHYASMLAVQPPRPRRIKARGERAGISVAEALASKVGLVAVLALLLAASSGCSVWRQARRTLITEPLEYSSKLDRGRSLKAYRLWADAAWAEQCAADGELAEDADYALGFRDGFVDYVWAGGDGEPPALPPRKYWNTAWRNPPGNAAAAQWFAGYRYGADVARSGGYRERGIVPSSFRWLGDAEASFAAPSTAAAQEEEVAAPGEAVAPDDAPTTPAEQGALPSPPPEEPYHDDIFAEPPMPADEPAAPELPPNMPTQGAAPLPEVIPGGSTGTPAPRTASGVARFRRAVSHHEDTALR